MTAAGDKRQKTAALFTTLERALGAIPDAIVVVAQTGGTLYVNDSAVTLFRRPRQELLGENIGFSFQDDEPQEVIVPQPDGHRVCEMRVVQIDWNGQPALLGSIRDVTELTQTRRDAVAARLLAEARAEQLGVEVRERERAEAALRAIEARTRFALLHANVGVWEMDRASGEMFWSDVMEAQFGLAPATFDGTVAAFLALIHPDDRAAVTQAIEQAAISGRDFSIRHRAMRPDGSLRWLVGTGRFPHDDRGRPGRGLGIWQDVTERQALEEQYRQSQKMEAIGNLTGGMAHDFNNLLGVIVGNLDLLQPLLPAGDDRAELTQEALDAALRGAELTQRLLAFARRQPLAPRPVALNDLVTRIAKLLARTLGEQIELTLDLAESVWPVVVDPTQLETAITNLATNARDAMLKGGRLTIATANATFPPAGDPAGDCAVLVVSDTGTGMTQEMAAKIFEPFFTTKEQGKGTGLGLSMVFGFIRQSGGHITVDSEPGRGSRFRLYFPRAPKAAREVPAPERVDPLAKGETVLVVEDQQALRRVIERQLTDLKYRWRTCECAAAALAILEQEKIDVVLTDVVMPGPLDGFDLARIAQQRWPDIKLVLMSGFPETSADGASTARSQHLPLLGKPFDKSALNQALRGALEG